MLREVSTRVNKQLRETDCLGRWGGEEFIIVAKQTDLERGTELAQRLCKSISESTVGQAGRITISIGVAGNDGELTLDQVTKQADETCTWPKGTAATGSSGSTGKRMQTRFEQVIRREKPNNPHVMRLLGCVLSHPVQNSRQ